MGLRSDTGLWEMPGGKVEDETVLEAALRELDEEVGARPSGQAHFLGYVDTRHLSKPRRSVDIYYLWDVEKVPYEPLEKAHRKWSWLPLSQSFCLMPSCRKACEMAMSFLEKR
jgi:8-oxo-dGTP pyrophosphatase MutT (NUDIX family)